MKRHAWKRDADAVSEERSRKRYQGHHCRQPYAFWLPPLRETRPQRRRRIVDENRAGRQSGYVAWFSGPGLVQTYKRYGEWLEYDRHGDLVLYGFKARNARRSAQ